MHLANDANRKAADAGERSLALARGRHTILVVDDAPAARYAAARLLRAAGFKAIEAWGGAEALRLAPTVSAVVLDVHLPDMHGFEVCRLLRSRPATALLPVVHVSAIHVSEDDVDTSRAVGANAYLMAPVRSDMLVNTLERLLGIGTAFTD